MLVDREYGTRNRLAWLVRLSLQWARYKTDGFRMLFKISKVFKEDGNDHFDFVLCREKGEVKDGEHEEDLVKIER